MSCVENKQNTDNPGNKPKKSVSFELCDHSGTGKIEQDEMERLLVSINDTASYFGDPVLKRAQIKVWCV